MKLKLYTIYVVDSNNTTEFLSVVERDGRKFKFSSYPIEKKYKNYDEIIKREIKRQNNTLSIVKQKGFKALERRQKAINIREDEYEIRKFPVVYLSKEEFDKLSDNFFNINK